MLREAILDAVFAEQIFIDMARIFISGAFAHAIGEDGCGMTRNGKLGVPALDFVKHIDDDLFLPFHVRNRQTKTIRAATTWIDKTLIGNIAVIGQLDAVWHHKAFNHFAIYEGFNIVSEFATEFTTRGQRIAFNKSI